MHVRQITHNSEHSVIFTWFQALSSIYHEVRQDWVVFKKSRDVFSEITFLDSSAFVEQKVRGEIKNSSQMIWGNTDVILYFLLSLSLKCLGPLESP